MEMNSGAFTIRSFLWETCTPETKTTMCSLLKSDTDKARSFCDCYFNVFHILHKIGHIITHSFNEHHNEDAALNEYYANIFAYKYLEFKKEKDYLKDLISCISFLLNEYKLSFDYHIPKMNEIFHKVKNDLLHYSAYNFNCIRKCCSDKRSFDEILQTISKGNLTTINSGIVPTPGLHGVDLVNECLAVVFELSGRIPDIKLQYCTHIALENLELLLE